MAALVSFLLKVKSPSSQRHFWTDRFWFEATTIHWLISKSADNPGIAPNGIPFRRR
jgi:hypothetical protein